MSDITLREALRKVFSGQDRKLAAEYKHRDRTPDCPPFERFFTGVFSGWTPDERARVTGCPYCQKTIGQIWVEQPPGLARLAEYVLSPETFPDREAMRYYLDHSRGRLENLVRVLLRSRGLLTAGTAATTAQLDHLRIAFGGLPDASHALASASAESGPQILLERHDPEAGLAFGLRIDSRGSLQAFLRKLDGTALDFRYWISVYGPTEPLKAELTPSGSSEAVANLGSAAFLLPRIGTDCLVTVEPAGEAT